MKKMKNLGKRGLSLLIVLVMCLGMMQLTAFAAGDEEDVLGELQSALASATDDVVNSALGEDGKADVIERDQQSNLTNNTVQGALEQLREDVENYVEGRAKGEEPSEPQFSIDEEQIENGVAQAKEHASDDLAEELKKDEDLTGAVNKVKEKVGNTLNEDVNSANAQLKEAGETAGEAESEMKGKGMLDDEGNAQDGYYAGLGDVQGEIDAAVEGADPEGLVEKANDSVDAALSQAKEAEEAAAGIVEAAEQAVMDAQNRDLTQEERQAAADQIKEQVEVLEESVEATNKAVEKARGDYKAASEEVDRLLERLAEIEAGVLEQLNAESLQDLRDQLAAAQAALVLAEQNLENMQSAQEKAEEMATTAKEWLKTAAEALGLNLEGINLEYTPKYVDQEYLESLVEKAQKANEIKEALDKTGIENPDDVKEAAEVGKALRDAQNAIEGIINDLPKGYTAGINPDDKDNYYPDRVKFNESIERLNGILKELQECGGIKGVTRDQVGEWLKIARAEAENSYPALWDTATANGSDTQRKELCNTLIEQLGALAEQLPKRDGVKGKLTEEDQKAVDRLVEGDKDLQNALDHYFEVREKNGYEEPIDWKDPKIWEDLLKDGDTVTIEGDSDGIFAGSSAYLERLAEGIEAHYKEQLEAANSAATDAWNDLTAAKDKVGKLEEQLSKLEEQLTNAKAKAREELQRQLDEARAELELKRDEWTQALEAQTKAQNALDKANEILEGLVVWSPDDSQPIDGDGNSDGNGNSDGGYTGAGGSSYDGGYTGPGGYTGGGDSGNVFGSTSGNASGNGSPFTDVPAVNAPETGVPGLNAPETGVPAANAPETGVPAANAPETGIPGVNAPETGIPGVNAPETGIPAVNAPETAVPDAGISLLVNAPETDAANEAETLVDIADGDVPLAGISNEEVSTGNSSMLWWLWLLLLLLVAYMVDRKIRQNKNRED